MASQQTDYMQARLERLLADVDNIARTSLQRERQMGHSDPLPYLSRMQPGAAMSLGLSAGMGAAPHGPGAVPRVQDARETRRQLSSPYGTPADRKQVPVASHLVTPRVISPVGAHMSAAMPHVATTPSTASMINDERGENSATASDDLPVSHDEAASLLLALPMSREPSGIRHFSPTPVPEASPHVSGVPMSKSLSGLSVSGCLSLLEDSPAPALASPRSGATTVAAGFASPRMRGVAMSKQASTVSVGGFLNDD